MLSGSRTVWAGIRRRPTPPSRRRSLRGSSRLSLPLQVFDALTSTLAPDHRRNLESWLPKSLWREINPLLVGFGQVRVSMSFLLSLVVVDLRPALLSSTLPFFASFTPLQMICKAPLPLCDSCTLGPQGLCPSFDPSAKARAEAKVKRESASPVKRRTLVKVEVEMEGEKAEVGVVKKEEAE